MNWVKNSILSKLFLIAGAGTAIVITATLFGFWLSWNSTKVFRDDVGVNYSNAFTVLSMETDFKKQVQEWKDVLLRGSDPASYQKYWDNFEKQEAKITSQGSELQSTLRDPEAQRLLEQFLVAHQQMGVSYRKGLQAFKDAGYLSSAGDNMVKGMDRPPTELLTATAKRLKGLALESSKTAIEHSFSGIVWSLAVIGLASLLAFIVFFLFIRIQILTPVRQLKLDLENLANCKFSEGINKLTSDEIGSIAISAEQVRSNLRQILSQVNNTAAEVSSAASSLHDTARTLAVGTQQVAAQIDTVSTAGAEMSATSQEIAANCSAAANNSRHSSELAAKGINVVTQTTAGMQRISDRVRDTARQVEGLGLRSDEIGNIVETIEDIADQTNLLALNAAIEAARAGEQGRGFAVVADEVRALAERTSRATKEIGSMIKSIQAETKEAVASMEVGVQEVEKSAAEAAGSCGSMQLLLGQIGEVGDQINQIASAAEEQSSTVSEISNNVLQITDVINETAKSTQETSAAAERLAQLAVGLKKVAGQFSL